MARLILKSPYIKSTGGAAGYLRYIATRERVEILPDDRPPTRKQEQLIAKLVKDFPDTKTLYEYESCQAQPTKAAASAFITLALESNWDALHQSEQYMKYIAIRPRAERRGIGTGEAGQGRRPLFPVPAGQALAGRPSADPRWSERPVLVRAGRPAGASGGAVRPRQAVSF